VVAGSRDEGAEGDMASSDQKEMMSHLRACRILGEGSFVKAHCRLPGEE